MQQLSEVEILSSAHFLDEETGAHRNEATHPSSTSLVVAELEFEPRELGASISALKHSTGLKIPSS